MRAEVSETATLGGNRVESVLFYRLFIKRNRTPVQHHKTKQKILINISWLLVLSVLQTRRQSALNADTDSIQFTFNRYGSSNE